METGRRPSGEGRQRQHNELTGAERKILGDELMGLADKLRDVTGMKSRREGTMTGER